MAKRQGAKTPTKDQVIAATTKAVKSVLTGIAKGAAAGGIVTAEEAAEVVNAAAEAWPN